MCGIQHISAMNVSPVCNSILEDERLESAADTRKEVVFHPLANQLFASLERWVKEESDEELARLRTLAAIIFEDAADSLSP